MASVKKNPSLFLQIASRTHHPGISEVPPTGVGAGGSGSGSRAELSPCSDAFAFFEERSNIRQGQNSVYQAKNSHGVNPTFP